MATLSAFEFNLIETLVHLIANVNYTPRHEIVWPLYLIYLTDPNIPEDRVFQYFIRTANVCCFVAIDSLDAVYIVGAGGPYIIEVLNVQNS